MRKLLLTLVCGSAWLGLLAPAAAAVAAAAGPAASTGNATAITSTSATLNGTVNPEGQATTYYFEYGTTTSYGAQTPGTDAGSGMSDVRVSAAISSLAPNTTYHYRLVASNAAGTTLGGDVSFRAPKPPVPTVSTRSPTALTQTSATLSAAVNPHGVETSYVFQYGTSTAYGSQTSAASAGAGTSAVLVSAAIGPLTPNTTYHYRVAATSANGTALGHDVSFRTVAVPAGITIGASSDPVTFGQRTTLSGRVLAPRPSRPTVILQTAPSVRGPWSNAGATTASTGGLYSFPELAPAASTYYRALSDGATSATLLISVRFRISLSVSHARPPADGVDRFQGHVAPGHRGHLVLIQRLGPFGHWHAIAVTHLRRFGFFSVKVRIRRAARYRALVVPDAGHAAGASRAVWIRVR